jgi:hypothetical protein
VSNPAFVGYLGDGFFLGFDLIHPHGELWEVRISGQDRAGEGSDVTDQVYSVILLVRTGEFMFPELACRVIMKIGKGSETPLAMFSVYHPDEIDGGRGLRKECFGFDKTSKVLGSTGVDFRCVKLYRIWKLEIGPVDPEKGVGIRLG